MLSVPDSHLITSMVLLLLTGGSSMKRLILGMSMNRSDLADWIDNHTWQVMVALAQLYLFPNGNRVHWRKEVWEKLSRVYPLKHSNKLPSAQFIFDSSWGRNKRLIGKAMQYALDKEDKYEPREHATVSEFYQICEDYLLWMSDRLAQDEVLVLSDVKQELDSLGLAE